MVIGLGFSVEQERESLRVAMENTTAGLKTELNNLKALLDQTLKDGDGVQERLTAANAELKELRLREAKILCDLENTQGTLASAISETEMLRGDFGHLKVCLAEIDRKKVKAERELEKESDRRQLLEQKLIHVETLLINEKEVHYCKIFSYALAVILPVITYQKLINFFISLFT